MKNHYLYFIAFLFCFGIAQGQVDSTKQYKKRVLESMELDFLISYYTQDGDNASVTGGVGTEELSDLTPTFVLAIPLNDDDVLTIDAAISAYSSASSSNLNPFRSGEGIKKGSPWVESSGASAMDTWTSINLSYSHSSDDRNMIWNSHVSFSNEYDYSSVGFGGGYARLFNKKNTELSINGNVYLDIWNPQLPIELRSYQGATVDLNTGFFQGIDILNQDGQVIDKDGANVWSPFTSPLQSDDTRNSYTLSVAFSQIVSKNTQFSLFADIVQQSGWLSNPMQRVYFSDRDNFYVGEAAHIPNYTNEQNTGVFHLADDIERLPDSRIKIPIGGRLNHYLNESMVLRTYYRFYTDDWGIVSNTFSVDLPIKLSDKYTLSPGLRYYTQTAADYFAGYEEHLSTDEYYTSDYDLSEFNSTQYSLGVGYKDIFTSWHVGKFRLKSVNLKYSYYDRDTGLSANIITGGVKFIIE